MPLQDSDNFTLVFNLQIPVMLPIGKPDDSAAGFNETTRYCG